LKTITVDRREAKSDGFGNDAVCVSGSEWVCYHPKRAKWLATDRHRCSFDVTVIADGKFQQVEALSGGALSSRYEGRRIG
jgi:hypothetical protein